MFVNEYLLYVSLFLKVFICPFKRLEINYKQFTLKLIIIPREPLIFKYLV